MSSAVSLPVSRPMGRALVVGQPALRAAPTRSLQQWGFTCTGADEPYDAMVQLCRRPLFFSAIVLSLNSLYREELNIIETLKRRFSHIDVWLTDTDGRHAALAEAMRLGADGLLAEDGLQRVAMPAANGNGPVPAANNQASRVRSAPIGQHDNGEALTDKMGISGAMENSHSAETSATAGTDPLLTAEELRALLQESPGQNPN